MATLETKLLLAAVAIAGSVAAYCFSRLYEARMTVRRYKARGLPVAPNHSFLFGHLLYLKSHIDALPPNAHYQYAFGDMGREHFAKEGCFYVDAWPVTGLVIVNFSPQVAPQVLQSGAISLERPSILPRFFKPIAGGPNLFDLGEREWRPWRAVFVKGFNAVHISSLVPGMVKETLACCKILEGKARDGKFFSLDAISLRFTMDMIGKTVLNTSLNAQQGYNILADSMLNQIRWHQADQQTNPLSYLNVVRWYVHWSNGRRMDRYVGDLLNKRYAEIYSALLRGEEMISKSVIDLILQAYATGNEGTKQPPAELDAEFRTFAIRQIRLFVFVGHDSTSSTICYLVHLLFGNREALHELRAEFDSVFGSDPMAIPDKILGDQNLLNKLPYATACIKEALRLFPPASASRQGQPGLSFINDEGQKMPTDDAFVLTIHTAMQRAPEYWPRPDDFLPQRFLVEPDHELYPTKNAWRPFEKGPRNCMAEGLVMTELKVVLAIVFSRFDFANAYDEFDRAKGHKDKAKRLYLGERAYQIEEGAAHPCDGYPCKVFVREKGA